MSVIMWGVTRSFFPCLGSSSLFRVLSSYPKSSSLILSPLLFSLLFYVVLVLVQMKAVSTVVADVEKALKIISDDMLIEMCKT